MIDFKQKQLKEWQDKNFPVSRYLDMPKIELVEFILAMQFSLGMMEELGEMAHHILKGIQGIRGGVNGINKPEVGDGFGDMIVFGQQLLSVLKMDSEKEVEKVIESVLKRDWINNPSGENIDKKVDTENNSLTYQELRKRIHKNYNSNFHEAAMPLPVIFWIKELCVLLEERK